MEFVKNEATGSYEAESGGRKYVILRDRERQTYVPTCDGAEIGPPQGCQRLLRAKERCESAARREASQMPVLKGA